VDAQKNDSARHEPERICALYSPGPHFTRMLRRLRETYPDEILVAAIPEDFPFSAIGTLAQETIRVPVRGAGSEWKRAWSTMRRIRRARCSHFVVMFDSPRLNLLSRASGAGRRWCYTVDGRFHPLTQALPALVVIPIWQRLHGEVAYWRARVGTLWRAKPLE